ncbi:MAG: hypothetical protein FWF15_01400 [Oscillospiraceae bacterium]|nr:hypothetical protein [Oscillospiraceae bacterium]
MKYRLPLSKSGSPAIVLGFFLKNIVIIIIGVVLLIYQIWKFIESRNKYDD